MEGILKKSPWQKLKRHFSEAFSEQFAYRRSALDGEGISREHRKRGRDAYRYILLLLALIVMPVHFHNLYTRQFLVAGVSLLLLVVLLANIWSLSRDRQAFLSPTVLLFLTIAIVLLAVSQGQNYSLYWLYPLMVALPVLLRSRRAIWLGVLSGLLIMPLLFRHFDTDTAIVIGLSMGLSWLVSAWLVFAVTEQSRRLRDMAITDPLTGAYNRRFLEVQARQAIDAWQRQQHQASMLLIDVDFFKRINDRYGHSVGDFAIKRLVEVISGRTRSVDIVCRFGGEEFVVLLHETGIDSALKVAEELRRLVESSKILPEGNMTISIGVCDVMIAENLDHWFNLADAALYLAKRNGRNRVEVATSLVDRESIARTLPDWR